MYVHFVGGYFDKCGGDIDGGDFAVGRFDLHSLQSQEILNRPVFVLEILNRVWTLWKFWTGLNRVWTLMTILKSSEQSLNILKFLNRVWTLLKTLEKSEQSENSEHYWQFLNSSEQSLDILNRLWTEFEHYWTFWTESEQCLKNLKTHFLHYYSTSL